LETGYINLIAEQIAKHLGIAVIPTFGRFMKHHGHAKRSYYGRENVFTLPIWLENENNFYQIATIAHEVSHFVDLRNGHGKTFRNAEISALAMFDLEPHYVYGLRYFQWLTIAGTNVVVWSHGTAKTKLRLTRQSWRETMETEGMYDY
jgi:hypothetical protein